MSKKQFKAFQIVSPFTLPGGKRYRRTPFYRAETKSEEETLMKASLAHELPEDAVAPTPPPAPVSSAPPAPTPSGAAFEDESDGQPDWEFMTKSQLRAWLDQAGVALPASTAQKDTFEALARDAWTAGRRPDPLWGFPGGPAPAPGLPGPLVTAESFAAAIEAAGAAGTPVSDESKQAFVELLKAREETLKLGLPRETQEDPQEPAGEPNAAETAEGTSEPTNAPSDAEAAEAEALTEELLADMVPDPEPELTPDEVDALRVTPDEQADPDPIAPTE